MWSSRSLHMRSYMRSGQCTAGSRAPRACAALLSCLIAGMIGGCSSVAPLPDSGLASAFSSAHLPRATTPGNLDEDGREAQRPPMQRMFPKDDDPTQPFSPNYGEVPLPQQEGWEPVPAPA